jgi:hypothetical protein
VDVLDLDKRPQCLTKTARLINFLLYWLVWDSPGRQGRRLQAGRCKCRRQKGTGHHHRRAAHLAGRRGRYDRIYPAELCGHRHGRAAKRR